MKSGVTLNGWDGNDLVDHVNTQTKSRVRCSELIERRERCFPWNISPHLSLGNCTNYRPLWLTVVPTTRWYHHESDQHMPNQWAVVELRTQAFATAYCCLSKTKTEEWDLNVRKKWYYNVLKYTWQLPFKCFNDNYPMQQHTRLLLFLCSYRASPTFGQMLYSHLLLHRFELSFDVRRKCWSLSKMRNP